MGDADGDHFGSCCHYSGNGSSHLLETQVAQPRTELSNLACTARGILAQLTKQINMEVSTLEKTISSYLQYMQQKYQISAAMIAGSYITGKMGPNSDIDIFMIWPYEYKTKRGREIFKGQEFEYFLSPEWVYYRRMQTDPVAVRVYLQSKIIFDPEEKLKRIKCAAQNRAQNLHKPLSQDQKESYLFWLETIRNDGIDLFDQGSYIGFAYYASAQLKSLTDLLEKVNNALPVYAKYGVEEVSSIDGTYGKLLKQFLLLPYDDPRKKDMWAAMCRHLENQLGNLDISTYEVETQL